MIRALKIHATFFSRGFFLKRALTQTKKIVDVLYFSRLNYSTEAQELLSTVEKLVVRLPGLLNLTKRT